MERRVTYQGLVICGTVVFFVWFALPYLSREPVGVISALMDRPKSVPIAWQLAIWSSVVLRLVSTVGLLLFKNWGRLVFVAWLLLNIFAPVIFGPDSASSPALDVAIGYVSTLLDGATLALTFTQPHRARFAAHTAG
jgi:hypothetical protein